MMELRSRGEHVIEGEAETASGAEAELDDADGTAATAAGDDDNDDADADLDVDDDADALFAMSTMLGASSRLSATTPMRPIRNGQTVTESETGVEFEGEREG